MSVEQERTTAQRSGDRWRGRLDRARFVIATAAVVFAAFAVSGALSPVQAIAGFAVVAVAAFLPAGEAAAQPAASQVLQRGETPQAGALLQPVVESFPDAVIALDADGRVVAFNERAQAFAPVLRHGERAALSLRAPELVEAIGRARASGEPQQIQLSQRVPADRWFDIFVTPVRRKGATRSERSELTLITLHDLTPLRRVEEMRADFVANASHELRTPLAALSGFIDTLKGPARDDPEARERFLSIMQAQAQRMARLIGDLLSLSRIELNEHRRPDTPVDLVPLVRQVANGLETLALDRGVAVSIEAPETPLIVAGDRDELIRLFENLTENALKYGAPGKRVDIRLSWHEASEGPGEVAVEVRDYGPGIAPEHLPRLTERFYRVDVGESRAQGGTGLGLALVKHILNRHRGRLAIESRPGEGAVFTVYLPCTGGTASGAESIAKTIS